MTAVIMETSKDGDASANKATSASPKPTPTKKQSDAKRFQGQPLVQWAKLEQAMRELLFYRVSGRHHTEREVGGEVRSHSEWRRQAVALARAIADGIIEGQLEPLPQPKPSPTETTDETENIEW